MENKKIYVHANITEMSKKIEKTLRNKLVKSGLRVFEELTDDTELIICIGGDGTLLYLMQEKDFLHNCHPFFMGEQEVRCGTGKGEKFEN